MCQLLFCCWVRKIVRRYFRLQRQQKRMITLVCIPGRTNQLFFYMFFLANKMGQRDITEIAKGLFEENRSKNCERWYIKVYKQCFKNTENVFWETRGGAHFISWVWILKSSIIFLQEFAKKPSLDQNFSQWSSKRNGIYLTALKVTSFSTERIINTSCVLKLTTGTGVSVTRLYCYLLYYLFIY